MTKIWYSELNLEMSEYVLGLEGPRGALVQGDELALDDGYWQDSFLYRACVDDRGRVERDHAQPHRRAGSGFTAGAALSGSRGPPVSSP